MQVAANLSSLSTISSQAQHLHVAHIATRSSLSLPVAVFRDTVDVLARKAKKIVAIAQHTPSKVKGSHQRSILHLLFPAGAEEPAETLPHIVVPLSSTDREAGCAWGIDLLPKSRLLTTGLSPSCFFLHHYMMLVSMVACRVIFKVISYPRAYSSCTSSWCQCASHVPVGAQDEHQRSITMMTADARPHKSYPALSCLSFVPMCQSCACGIHGRASEIYHNGDRSLTLGSLGCTAPSRHNSHHSKI